MANISDYLNTAKEMINNAIKAIGEQNVDKEGNGKGFLGNSQNHVDPIVPDESAEGQDGNAENEKRDS